jgi:hypothetical protein
MNRYLDLPLVRLPARWLIAQQVCLQSVQQQPRLYLYLCLHYFQDLYYIHHQPESRSTLLCLHYLTRNYTTMTYLISFVY